MIIISQKNDRFFRRFDGYHPIVIRAQILLCKPVIGTAALSVVKSQTNLQTVRIPDRPVQIFLLQESQFIRFSGRTVDLVRPVAHSVNSGLQGSTDGFRIHSEIMMHIGNQRHCAAVSYRMKKAVLILQNCLHLRVKDARHTVDPVVSRHHTGCTAFRDNSPERLEIKFIPVAGINARILPSSAVLRIISIKVLERCSAADIIRVVSLHPFYIGRSHLAGKKWIFPVIFLISSPSWISLEVNGRCPP